MRRSCNLLTRPEMEGGKTPTTPTISSIIAGVQCQEAVKLLHGLETITGRGWVFDGFGTDAYQVEFQRKETCYSHDPLDEVIALDAGADDDYGAGIAGPGKTADRAGRELELGRTYWKSWSARLRRRGNAVPVAGPGGGGQGLVPGMPRQGPASDKSSGARS